MDVASGIHIPIMGNAACRAHPMANSERKCVKKMTTVETTLTGWVPLVELDEVSPIPFRFVCELGHKLIPSDIVKSFGKRMVFSPVLDCQRLHADRLVLTDQACRELLQEITAAIGYSGMDTSNFPGGFSTVLRSLALLRMTTLSLCQFLFICGEERGVDDSLDCREDHEVFEPQVGPDGWLCWLKVGNLFFNQDAYARTDRQCLSRRSRWLAWHRWAKGCGQRIFQGIRHFCQSEHAIMLQKSRSCILSTLLVTLLLEGRVFGVTSNEGVKGFIQEPQGLLHRGTRYLIQPRMTLLFLQVGEHGRCLAVIQTLVLFVIGIGAQTQAPVVDGTSAPKRLRGCVKWPEKLVEKE